MTTEMSNNRKYKLKRNESVYDKTAQNYGLISGHYRCLSVSPLTSTRVKSFKISATDSHIPSTYMATLPFTAIGRQPYRPFHFNSKIKGKPNSNVYSKAIHVIPKDLFDLLPESKVDPDVLSDSYSGKVCQTYCSDGTAFVADSHTTGLQLDNSSSIGSDDKVFPCLSSKAETHSVRKGFHNEEKSSVFTLVGRQIVSSDKSAVKYETNEKQSKSSSGSFVKCSGTLFTVLASPKHINRRQISHSNEQKTEINEEINELNANSDVKTGKSTQINSCLPISENDNNLKAVKVSEKLNFKLSVPQELPIQSIKEFCCVMSEDTQQVIPNEKLEVNKENEIFNDLNVTKLFEVRKQLSALKSPTIVKEVMKKMSTLPSGGFDHNIHIKVTESHPMNNIIHINGNTSSVGTDAETMLVLQELDRSIAEGSPSNANSPLINPRIVAQNRNSNQQSMTGHTSRPNKPPRLINYSSIESKRKTLIEVNERQTDNLIEELYLSDENGSKSKQTIVDKTIESVEQNNNKHLNQTQVLHISDNSLQNHKNIIDLNINYNNMKQMSVETSNDFEGAIARASLSSVDSGTSSPNSSHFIVVAIDFGTTFSGYSFAFTRDAENAIHMMRKVEGCDPDVSNQKIPTILLLNTDGAFHSFGFAARDHYSSLDPKDAKKWFYFEKFKMDLHYQQCLSLETKIKATNSNKSMSALTVFAHALRYFKLLALQELSDQSAIDIINEDIRWVLTVPAIWKPSAKQFMRAAAYEAGIGSADNPYQLLIALEPEVASIYCRRLKMNQLVPICPPRRHTLFQENNDSKDDGLAVDCDRDMLMSFNALNRSQYNETVDNSFNRGTKYIVVDVGGGTVDITCHQIQSKEGSLKELHKATGGPNGSIGVDLNFEKLLSEIFGTDFMKQFKCKRPAGYVDLMAAFEARKRSASPLQTTTSNISLPFSFINFFKKSKGTTVENAVKKYSEGKGISYCSKLGMLRLEPVVMQQLFAPVAKQIISHIWDILNSKPVKDVSYLFLVGGFAESQILQSYIRNAFSSRLKVIIPQSPNLAILRGATIYGLDPTVISCRRARLTYGVGVLNRFIRGKHPLHKLAIKDDIEWCADVFDKFVVCDQSIGLYESITRSYTPVKEGQTCSIIHIYCTEAENSEFITDEGVQRCGTLYLDLDHIQEPSHINPALKANIKREIQTQMIFGDTEIKVCALDVRTGKCVKAEIDFLNN